MTEKCYATCRFSRDSRCWNLDFADFNSITGSSLVGRGFAIQRCQIDQWAPQRHHIRRGITILLAITILGLI